MPRTNKATLTLDAEIGAAIRSVRTIKGMSQTALGDVLGVTFQQLQKFESGINRLSASQLIVLCKALQISPMDIIGSQFDQPSDIARIATKG